MIRILLAAVVTFGGLTLAARGQLGDRPMVAIAGGVLFVVGLLAVVREVGR